MTLSYRKAIDRMRQPGAHLIQTHGAYGNVHYVVPGGYVEPATAERLKKHPLVRAGEDGLFPGYTQTWRVVS
jgi:hypothetical protein